MRCAPDDSHGRRVSHDRWHALELAREGVPPNIIQRQLGHANLGITAIYLRVIDPEEDHRHCPRAVGRR